MGEHAAYRAIRSMYFFELVLDVLLCMRRENDALAQTEQTLRTRRRRYTLAIVAVLMLAGIVACF
jgi:hypothetical protein